eukprot:m.49151 g.49151  ORF g.49151 m.49151 type:complete len:1362 (+) comp6094_c0_seq1:38-4123(+)
MRPGVLAGADTCAALAVAIAGAIIDGGRLYTDSADWRSSVLDVVVLSLARAAVLLVLAVLPRTPARLNIGIAINVLSLIYTAVKFGLMHYDDLVVPLGLSLWALLTGIALPLVGVTGWSQARSAELSRVSINGSDETQPLLLGKTAGTPDQVEKPKVVSVLALFRFADATDTLLMIFGALCSIGHGVSLPVFMIYFGDVIENFSSTNIALGDMLDKVKGVAVIYLYLGAAAFATAYFQVAVFVVTGQRQGRRMRRAYFRSLLRQEMGWYDTQETGSLTARLAADIAKVEEAISDKFSSALQFLAMFIGGFAVGFIYSWKLTLVILSVSPLLMGSGAIFAKMMAEMSGEGQSFYAAAGAVADEVITLMRTVMAFGTQEREHARYAAELRKAELAGRRKALYQGLSFGLVMLIVFLTYALSFWYGGKLVREEGLSAASVVTVFFSVIMGAMAIGQAAPGLTAISTGRGVAVAIYEVIDRVSQIDGLGTTGQKLSGLEGRLELCDVRFSYPTRPSQTVLAGMSLAVKPGQTYALVGPSGCGKSTVVALLERFYDPSAGAILLDGTDLRKYNVPWLRSHISLVSQMPTLFPMSIYDNIASGKPGATQEEVIQAARNANAHDFIMQFPDKYNTQCGDRGTQLSGGQKQRIAIARALIGNPRLLILDEATSALDTASEAVVQQALDRACQGRTTIVIAHRLSTIQGADCIGVVQGGRIVEEGTHSELMAKNGLYSSMVASQTLHGGADKESAKVGEQADKADKAKTDVTLDAKEASDAGEDIPEPAESVALWALRMSRPEWLQLALGALGCAGEGVMWPAFSIVLSEMIGKLIEPDNEAEVAKWTWAFVIVGAVAFVAMVLKIYYIGVAGEALTRRLREKSFWSIINQEAQWLDQPTHRRALLTTRLAADAATVRGLVGERLAMALTAGINVFGGIILALFYCWRVALVVLGSLPFIAIGGALQMKLMSGFGNNKHYEESWQLAGQNIENIRTVLALGRGPSAYAAYRAALHKLQGISHKQAQVQGIAFGVTEFAMFGIWSLAFWYGATQVEDDNCSFTDMFKAVSCIVFGAMMAGQAAAMGPDAVAAKKAAARIHHLVSQTPDSRADGHGTVLPAACRGEIEFRDVEFAYQLRPDAKVLRKFNLKIPAGTTMAVVGPSGAGKSTLTSLLERFYEPTGGSILFDGVDIARLQRKAFRHHVGLVMQEPQLFSCSIGDNIRYGGEYSDEDVHRAAREANAHDFVAAFPAGYGTKVGDLGSQLSGGQRQRVAIARALAAGNDVKLLLLDEATSALDTHNEKIVQEALDKARQGRTTLIIAHRLSTIQNADCIAVLDQGVVAELGTHEELLARGGIYAQLVRQQQLGGAQQ